MRQLLDKISFEYLPILPTGTCIFAGLLANVRIPGEADQHSGVIPITIPG